MCFIIINTAKKMKQFIVLVASSFMICCNGQTRQSATTTINGKEVLSPVETEKANTGYAPAFTGQTRIAGMKTQTDYKATVITNDLNRPWGIVVLPDGRFLITEKGGSMRIVTANGNVSEKISGIPTVNDDGQGGLLGLALDPQFTTNRMVYWVFSERTSDGNLTAVAKGRLADNEKSIEQAQIIYRATPAHNSTLHYGGRVLFDKDGYIYISTGERSDIETRPQAQQLNSALGKVLRITTDGKPAPGNPFANDNSKRAEIYSYGHRNVQGLAIDPSTGDLWEGEFGPRGGDEINRIEPGKNYGWPDITYGIEYSGGKVGPGITQKAGMEQPVYYWDPVLSPSGMTFCNSTTIPEWKNNLFICGLSSMHIARLRIENNKVTGEERLLEEEKQRFRDVVEGKDGALYAVTDQGKLYRIGKQ